MFGAIVLRDIPKQEIQIDLTQLPIQGGFRGFNMVPPGAWHYVSVKDGDNQPGFWCYIAPDAAVVKVYDARSHQFREADADTDARYSRLALSGGMGVALQPYPAAHFTAWFRLDDKIPAGGLPTLHAADAGGGASRFERVYQGTHGGDADNLLAEFQYAFARWLVTQATGAADEAAFARWRHLVLAAYNAGERRMAAAPALFAALVDGFMRQFDLLPDDWFTAAGFLASRQGDYLAEDMIDSAVPLLVEKGEAFAAYLARRRS